MSIAHLETVIRPLQGLFAGGKALPVPALCQKRPGQTLVSNGGFAELGVSSYTCPSSSVRAQTLTGRYMAELSLSP